MLMMNGEIQMEDDTQKQIEELTREITTGWVLYGPYLDTGNREHPIAVELRNCLQALEKKRSFLQLEETSKVTDFIKKHGGINAD
jgi:hypothetical protein